jgi:hypothetical protein
VSLTRGTGSWGSDICCVLVCLALYWTGYSPYIRREARSSQSTSCRQPKARLYASHASHASLKFAASKQAPTSKPGVPFISSITPKPHRSIIYPKRTKMGLFKSLKSKSKHTSSTPSSNGQSPRKSSAERNQTYATHQRNVSTSNLSSTSTLTEAQTSKPSRPSPPSRMTSYEAFLYQSRIEAEKKEAREHAWKVAAQRRLDSSMWPAAPWSGGFGSPVSRSVGGRSVEGWLASNGLRK